jgi:hypothetical protein
MSANRAATLANIWDEWQHWIGIRLGLGRNFSIFVGCFKDPERDYLQI